MLSKASNQIHTADVSMDMSNYSATRPANTLIGMGSEDTIERLIELEKAEHAANAKMHGQQVSRFEMMNSM